MPGPYINNGNYRYGRSEYDQPQIPQYNSTLYHKNHAIREFPNKAIKDDGAPYKNSLIEPSCCETCNKCNKINRDNLMANLINIESFISKVLTITLYGTSADLDKVINMKIGNKYCITYASEKGLRTVTGTFKELSPNMPDDCTRYIGNYTSVTTAAYIGLDCSKTGESDKRLIYIASIRYIEEVFDDDEDPYKDLTQDEKLILMLNKVSSTLSSIDQYIETNTKTEEDDEENDIDNQTQPDKKPPLPPPHQPPIRTPIIIGARPPFFPPPPPRPEKAFNEEDNILVSEDLVSTLNDIKTILSSFINTYIDNETKTDDDKCNCDDDLDDEGEEIEDLDDGVDDEL